jgi:eukaryotic-like serine/threonine-protein kinase
VLQRAAGPRVLPLSGLHGRAVTLTMAAVEHQKYRVIKRLEAGGMAEVYLGEAVSVQGFRKKVAIKRVLPHLAQNQSFIEMFLDEARLSARLDHANIVSVFDISKREDTYFLIMEFVDGVNLKRILESLTKRGQRIRLVDAVHLAIEACRGLSYAHELVDEQGHALGIVHRDISPPNIMVTRRGEVKLADFGLAKASTQIQTTDPGVVKGKFSYLSPEAANGLPVDARTDIFAIGIVLWEMLAGKRLFWGENDYATVKLIQKANVPRLAPLNREVDEAFEEVLLKALTRDPGDRYQSAREFGAALADYLFSHQLMVTSYDLARMVELVTGEGAAAPEEQSLIDRLIQEELDESVGISSESGSLPKQQGSGGHSIGGDENLEDPASWFNDDADLFGDHNGQAQPAAGKPQAQPRREAGGGRARADESAGAWREAGIADQRQSPVPVPSRAAPPAQPKRTQPRPPPPNGLAPRTSGQPVPAAVRRSAAAPIAELDEHEIELDAEPSMPPAAGQAAIATAESRMGSGKLIMLCVLAVAIAIAAWLGVRS